MGAVDMYSISRQAAPFDASVNGLPSLMPSIILKINWDTPDVLDTQLMSNL